MKIAYFDCFSGISGDMTLGALVDVGVPPEILTDGLATLKLDAEFSLHFEKSVKHGITGTRAIVEVHPAHTPSHEEASHEHSDTHTHEHSHTHTHGHSHHHEHGPSRHLSDIFKLLDDSDLDAEIRDTAKRVFDRLAAAEAKVHNTTKDKVHLHEVSGIDSIVDIVGSVIGLTHLNVDAVYASPLSLGQRFCAMCTRTHACPCPRHDGTPTRCTGPSNGYSQRVGNPDGCCTHYDAIARIRSHATDAARPRRIWCWVPATSNNVRISSASVSVKKRRDIGVKTNTSSHRN